MINKSMHLFSTYPKQGHREPGAYPGDLGIKVEDNLDRMATHHMG